MSWWVFLLLALGYTAVVFWAGMRYGNALEGEERRRLAELEARWANTVAALKGERPRA